MRELNMKKQADEAEKKFKKQKVKTGDWKETSRTKVPGGYEVTKERSGKREGGIGIEESYKKVDKKRFPTIDSYRNYVREYNKGKTETRKTVEKPEPIKPMGTISSPIPPVTGRRKTPPIKVPVKKTPSIAMYGKEKKTQSPDYGISKRTGTTTSPVKAALAYIDPTRKVVPAKSGEKRWHRGAKQRVSTTRPASEKQALNKEGDLKKGYKLTEFGSEGGGPTKKTKSGLKKESSVKKKYQKSSFRNQ